MRIKECDKIGILKYSTWYINVVSFIITIIVMLSLNRLDSDFIFSPSKAILKAGFSVNTESQNQVEVFHSSVKNREEKNWCLEIPKINLKATIAEGTTKETMDKYIAHFEETQKWIGNICLAAHNRGYENNYFAEVKTLNEGDKIIYYYQNNCREYIVEKNEIIQATDLTCLENTEENRLTLITCVENEPNYRRYIKAIEDKK